MEVEERDTALSEPSKQGCVGAECIESDEDSQMVEEEDEGEVSDENDPKPDETDKHLLTDTQKLQKGTQNEDELDYEEDVEEGEEDDDKGDKEEDEDGEVNSDDDLEEGEVKEDSDGDGGDGIAKNAKGNQSGQHQKQQNRGQANQKNICKFFHKGQCTWGPSCRFVHQAPAGHKRKYNYAQLPPGPRPRPPDDYYYDHPPPPPPHIPLLPRMPPPHLAPIPPPPPAPQEVESAWERGLRHAKAMIVRATRRKEEEIDFDEKRFNLGVDDDHSHHSRESLSPSPRGRSVSPPYHHRERRDDYWSTEYERRRRLAYESAPWNDEPSSPSRNIPRNREAAEQYRDPWRRSKSPPVRRPGNQRRGESSSGRHSHSMSSISGTDSASDLSGSSFSGSSFSGSESPFSEGSDFEKSPVATHRKEPPLTKSQAKASPVPGMVNQKNRIPLTTQRNKAVTKPVVAKEKLQPQVAPKPHPRAPVEEETGGNKKKVPPGRSRRDSWSDSDSASGSQSGSSFYSGSESGSEAMSESGDESKPMKPKKSPIPSATKQAIAKSAKTKENVMSAQEASATTSKKLKTIPSTKALKADAKSNARTHRQLSPECSPTMPTSPSYSSMKSIPSPNSVTDVPQKKPIKMTFMKKHSNLKKDVNVTAKLNGGKGSEGEDEQNSGDNEANEITSPETVPEPSKNEPIEPLETGDVAVKETMLPLAEIKSKPSSGSAVVSSTTGGGSASRREELLKQLKAVEDAIARKRAKLH